MRAVPGQHQAPAAPRGGDQRMEGIDRGALDADVVRADGVGQHRPDPRRPHDLGLVVAGHEHDLEAMPGPLHVHPGHRPARVAVLDRMVGKPARAFRPRARDDVDDEPGLVQAEVERRGADSVADQRPRAVAADDVARGQLARCAGRHFPDGDRSVVARVADGERLVPETDLDVREARDALAEHRVELRLVEVPVARPAVRPRSVGAAAHHEGLARRVDEVHPLRGRARDAFDRLGEPRGLEDAHDLAVEVNGPRQGMDVRVALQHQHAKPVPAEEVGEQRADRAEADDDDIEVRLSHPAARPCARPDPPSRLHDSRNPAANAPGARSRRGCPRRTG